MFEKGFLVNAGSPAAPAPSQTPQTPAEPARGNSPAVLAAEMEKLQKALAASRLEAREARLLAEAEKHAAATLRAERNTEKQAAEQRCADANARFAAEQKAHGITKQLLQIERNKAKQGRTTTAVDENATLATLSRDLRQLKIAMAKEKQPPIVVDDIVVESGSTGTAEPSPDTLTYASSIRVGNRQAAPLRPLPAAPDRQTQAAELEGRLGLELDDATRRRHEDMKGSRRFGYSPVVAKSLVVDRIPKNPKAAEVLKTLTDGTNCTEVIFDVSSIGHAKEEDKDTKVRYEIFHHPDHTARVRDLLQYFCWPIDDLFDPVQPPPTKRTDMLSVCVAHERCSKRYGKLRSVARPETRNYIDQILGSPEFTSLEIHTHIPPKRSPRHRRRRKKQRGGAPNGRVLEQIHAPPEVSTVPTVCETVEDVEMEGVIEPHRPRPDDTTNDAKRQRQEYQAGHDALVSIALANQVGHLLAHDQDDREWRPGQNSDDSENEYRDASTASDSN